MISPFVPRSWAEGFDHGSIGGAFAGDRCFYSRDEFNDVVRRLSADPRRPLRLHTDAKDYVFELTGGHSGAFGGVIGMVEQVLQSSFYIASTKISQAYRSDLKHSEIDEVTKDHIVDLLDDEEKSLGYLAKAAVHRSFVNLRKVTVEAVAALKATMIKGSIPRDLGDVTRIGSYTRNLSIGMQAT